MRASASSIRWLLDDDKDDKLPVMKADVMLTYRARLEQLDVIAERYVNV